MNPVRIRFRVYRQRDESGAKNHRKNTLKVGTLNSTLIRILSNPESFVV